MPLRLKDPLSKKEKFGFVYVETQEKKGMYALPVLISL